MAVDVPEYISANAVRALDNTDSKGGGVTPKTVREARELVNGTVSEDKVRRMAAWFARHKSDLVSPAANEYLNGNGKMTAGQWAWLAWGGDITTTNRMRAMEWAERKRDQLIESGDLKANLQKALKRENGEDFPEEAFAYAPDADKVSTWKLRLWDSIEEKETAAQIGRALAALGRGGFRGNRVKIPIADLPKVKAKILSAWRKTHPDATRDEEPTVLKGYGYDDEYKDSNEDYSEDAMTLLLMAYRTMLNHPECAPLLEPLMALIHMKEMIMLENIGETHIVLPAEMADEEEIRYRAPARKIISQEDGQYCVTSETGRKFGCYVNLDMAENRLAQIESFAKRRITKASSEELIAWHDRLHASVSVTDGMVICHDVITDELEAREKSFALVKSMSGLLPVAKAEENRFTLGPVYVPGFEDAHGEFTDDDTLQKALWNWMKAGDRTIYLQHSEKAAGEMVEMLTWPMPIETELEVPNEGVTKYSFPENTPFMGVIWEPWAWEMVKAGELRGYSIGGKAQRMEADLPEAALV